MHPLRVVALRGKKKSQHWESSSPRTLLDLVGGRGGIIFITCRWWRLGRLWQWALEDNKGIGEGHLDGLFPW